MSAPPLQPPRLARLAPAPVGWATVVVLALVMALTDAFVLTSIQGAVGAIERAQHPFLFWLRVSLLTAPLFVLAVLGALAIARRVLGPALRTPLRVLAAVLLIAGAGGVVGSAEMVVSAGYDYALQTHLTQTIHSTHPAAAPGVPGACTGECAEQRAQFEVDERAARLGSVLALGANVVVVGWAVAFRGGRLEPIRPLARRRAAVGGVPAG
jgi:hypothetical protein